MNKILNFLKNWYKELERFFSDVDDPNEAGYEPIHVAGMIVLVLFGITILFWLLWALLVFGGGIFAKVMPFLQIVFTSKTAADFGYIGYPYEMGVFSGWPTNLVALIFAVALIIVIWFIFKYSAGENKLEEGSWKKEERQ